MSATPPIYQIQNLKHTYNGRLALDIETLHLERHRIIGLMGPNGSGKSTLLKFLGFIESPLTGDIYYQGKIEKPFSAAVRAKVALLPQTPYLLRRSVFDNIAYSLNLKKSDPSRTPRIHEALRMVGLDEKRFAGRRWRELSGGETQRVALAARLALRPETLLLDEPTASVDAASAQLIKQAALQAQQEWGATIIIASHDRQWLNDVCNTSLYLFKGRVFDSMHENILFGPWVRLADHQWAKTIQPGLHLFVPEPPTPDAIAVIDPQAVSLRPPPAPGTATTEGLPGTITQLTLGKIQNQIMISVRLHNCSLTALTTETEMHQSQLFPGRKVTLTCNWRSVRWL